MLGPGKYNKECTDARVAARADGLILIVINGYKGHGFEVQADLEATLRLPATLRLVADDIERSFANSGTH